MIKLKNKTFTGDNCPKSTIRVFEGISLFKEALFQFNSFFMLQYVQLGSPISQSENFTRLFFVISMVLIAAKLMSGFWWSIASHILENCKFKYGRYRSMTFIGAVLSTFFSLMTFFVAPLFGSGWGYVIAFLVFYTCSECVFSFNDIAYWSYINKMSYDAQKRSKIVGITNLISSLGSYAVTALSPAISAGNAKTNMTILLIVILSCYFVTQMAYCYILVERAEEPEFSMKTNKGSVFDPIRIMFTDKQVFLVMIAFFLMFLSQDLIAGNTSSYFYYEYGYGGFSAVGVDGGMSGGVVSFIFSLCFGIAVCVSSYIYPYITKALGKKKTILIFLVAIVILYFLMFFFAMTRGREIMLFIVTALLGFSHGMVLMTCSVNVVNVAEYYQAKTGEERSASMQAGKALMVKTANGVQTGLFYMFLALSPNLLDINKKVANLEALNNRGSLDGNITTQVNDYIQSFTGIENSLTIYRSSLTLLPIILMIAAVVVTCFVYVTSEKKYAEYVEIVKSKKNSNVSDAE